MLRVRDHLYHCRSGDRTIFLDVDANRYFCLSDELERMFQAFNATILPGNDKDFAALLERRILVCDPLTVRNVDPIAPPRPTRNLRVEVPAGWNITLTAQALAHHALVRHKIRHASFSTIIDDLTARSRKVRLTPVQPTANEIARIVSAFDKAGLILGVADQCLIRSISMLAMMHRVGTAPYLIFGVRTNPFSAHCWVQDADVVLNDAAEHARLFEPILAV